MDNYERLEKAYESYFAQIDKVWLLWDQFDIARDKGDYYTCYKILSKNRQLVLEATKKLDKAKAKFQPVVV